MKIIAKAPCRISLIGGGTDVDPFASMHGGKVFNLAISLYNQVILVPHQSKQVQLSALGQKRLIKDLSKTLKYGEDKTFDLCRAVLNHYRKKIPSGFSLKTQMTADSLLGLGRSGSVAVAMLAAFNSWLGLAMTPLKLGLLAAKLETDELGWTGGKQDSLSAAHGGLNLMFFGPGKKVKVSPIKLSKKTIQALSQRTFLVYIGGDRHSADQQEKLVKGMTEPEKIKALIAMRDTVDDSILALKQEKFKVLGEILHQGWLQKIKANPSVTNQAIDQIYSLARKKGAYGGKVAGSGGAGHMFFICPKEKKPSIINSLAKAGAKLVEFDYDFNGVTTKKL